MKKWLMVLALLAMLALMATPAVAQDALDDGDDDDFDNGFDRDDVVFVLDDESCDFAGDDDCDVDDEDEEDGEASNNFDSENELSSGDLEQDFKVVNFGDYANQCVPANVFGNTGNFNNSPTSVGDGGEDGEFEPEGIDFSFSPESNVDCSYSLSQNSEANSYGAGYSAGYYDGYWAY